MRFLNIRDHFPHQDLCEWVAEVDDAIVRGNFELRGVCTYGVNSFTDLARCCVTSDILLSDFIQFLGKLDSDDFAKRVVGCRQKCDAHTRSVIDKGEVLYLAIQLVEEIANRRDAPRSVEESLGLVITNNGEVCEGLGGLHIQILGIFDLSILAMKKKIRRTGYSTLESKLAKDSRPFPDSSEHSGRRNRVEKRGSGHLFPIHLPGASRSSATAFGFA